MREVEVGTRLDPKAGLSDFGIEEVNELLRRGGRVVRIEGAGAIFKPLTGTPGQMYFGGFALRVFVEEPTPPETPDAVPGTSVTDSEPTE
jgi:hypothetical protein